MLRSLYVIFDYHVAATDGDVGRVQDFLLDDESWIVHYLVARIGFADESRKVLIAPVALMPPDWETKRLPVRLTREEVAAAPALDSDRPISRQREFGLKRPGSHLRSIRELLGYDIYAKGTEIGCVEDFIVEDTLWDVHHVVVSVRSPKSRSIVVSPQSIRSISWTAKAVWLNVSPRDIETVAAFDPTAPINRNGESHSYDYYGRPVLARM